MNILTDKLPEGVKVNGTFFYLNTDFRAGVEFEEMLEKGEENIFALLRPYFPGGCPEDIAGAFEAAVTFYCCGERKTEESTTKTKRAYSFSVDADAIFADFWQFYKIDLSTEQLHWFVFRSLLMGLPEESGFKKRVYYRTCELKDLPKKEKERIGKIRKAINIEQEERSGKKTLADRDAQMLAYVQKRNKEINKGGGLNG